MILGDKVIFTGYLLDAGLIRYKKQVNHDINVICNLYWQKKTKKKLIFIVSQIYYYIVDNFLLRQCF